MFDRWAGASVATITHPVTAIDRLRDAPPSDGALSWFVTIAISLVAFVIRLIGLGYPTTLMFDETYYAKDAWALLNLGYEANWTGGDLQISQGNPDGMGTTGSFIVHPPVGKWIIASGEYLFGMTSFGWRFGALIFGTLLVAVTIRLGRRLSRSTLIGAMAGLFLTVDGLSFVMSRIALLDIFQSFFIVAAVSCVVADRDWFRHRLADHLDSRHVAGLDGRPGPFIVRPWLIGAGLLFGLALGTKWNSVFPLAVFGVVVVVWSVQARRLAGAGRSRWWALVKDGGPAFVSMVVLGAVVYVATWARWLATQGGYDRQWGAEHPDSWETRLLGAPFASLLQYHRDIYGFHTGNYINGQTHTYNAHPAGWLVVARTIGIDAVNGIQPGQDGCVATGTDTCLRVITGLGTPLLWWAAALALLVSIVWWLAGADWRFGVPVMGALATYLPWFMYTSRPLFFFYAITIIPFTAIGLAMVCGVILGPSDGGARRRRGAIVVGALVALIVLNFAFIYPVLTDQLLTRTQWLRRMWFSGWV